MMNDFIGKIEQNPIIAAIRNEEDIEDAVDAEVGTIFLLQADIFNIQSLVNKVKAHGKNVFVHMDFLEGIGKDHKAIDYIARIVKPDGIISTKSNHIKYAKQEGIFTIQRFFLVDSLSYETTIHAVQTIQPDMIEIMPGVIPGVIKRINNQLSVPIIAGGLIVNKQDIIDILKAGALGVSTGKKELWSL